MLSIISNNDPFFRLYGGLFLSLLLAFGTTPLVKRFAVRLNRVATPSQDRWHSKPTPLLGGLAIFIAFFLPYLLFYIGQHHFWVILGGAFLALSIGLFDDFIRINPSTKLIGQILIACFMVRYGLRLAPAASPLWSMPLTVLWIAGIMNAMNLLDNMDGLAGGIAVISASFLLLNSLLNGYSDIAILMSLIVGAALGFLYYNFSPAKIFMGDSGSMLLGYLLAVGSILQIDSNASHLVVTLALPVLVLSVPVFDTTFVTVMRKLHQRPISQGGRDHASHRLVAFGLSERKAVLTLYAVSSFLGILSLLYAQLNPAVMAVLIGLVGIALFSFGKFLGEIKVYTDEGALRANGDKKGWILLDGIVYHKRRVVEVLVDFAIICLSYISAILLRYEGIISPENLRQIRDSLPLLIGIKFVSFFSFGLYRGVWRYVSLNDLLSIFKAVLVGELGIIAALVFVARFESYSRSVFVIDGLLSLVLIGGSRVALALFRDFFISMSERKKRILIMGAGDGGEFALREIRNNHRLDYQPVGFIDDDLKKQGYRIHGIPVLGTRHQLVEIAKRRGVQEVLIAIPSISNDRFRDVYENCKRHNILCYRMPFVIPPREEGGDGGQESE